MDAKKSRWEAKDFAYRTAGGRILRQQDLWRRGFGREEVDRGQQRQARGVAGRPPARRGVVTLAQGQFGPKHLHSAQTDVIRRRQGVEGGVDDHAGQVWLPLHLVGQRQGTACVGEGVAVDAEWILTTARKCASASVSSFQ